MHTCWSPPWTKNMKSWTIAKCFIVVMEHYRGRSSLKLGTYLNIEWLDILCFYTPLLKGNLHGSMACLTPLCPHGKMSLQILAPSYCWPQIGISKASESSVAFLLEGSIWCIPSGKYGIKVQNMVQQVHKMIGYLKNIPVKFVYLYINTHGTQEWDFFASFHYSTLFKIM